MNIMLSFFYWLLRDALFFFGMVAGRGVFPKPLSREEEAAALVKAGEERAARRREELKAVADVKNSELRARAEENMEKAAAWVAQALSEV